MLLLACTGLLSALAIAANEPPLSLDEAIQIGLIRAHDVIQSKEDLLLVDAEWLQAVGTILPRVDLASSAGEVFAGTPITEARFPNAQLQPLPGELPQFVYGPFIDGQANNYSQPNFTFTLSTRQLIYDGGRWWKAIGRADDLGVARRAALRAVEGDVRLRITQRYYDLAKAESAEATLERQTEVGHKLLERAQAFLAAGRGKPADVASAARNLMEDEIALARQGLLRAQATRALNLDMGRDAATPIVLALDVDTVGSSTTAAIAGLISSESLLEQARARRPELQQLAAEIDVKCQELGMQRATYFPTFTLDATYRRSSRRPDRVFADPTEHYYAGLDLTMRWNLFEGRANEGRVQAAEVAMNKAKAQYQELERRIGADVEDRRQALLTQHKVWSLAERSIGAAQEAVRLARGLYDEGRGTVLEVRDADLRLIQAQLTAINAKLDLEVAKEALRHAIGGEVEPTTVRGR